MFQPTISPFRLTLVLAGGLLASSLTACKDAPPPPPDDAALTTALTSKLADDGSLAGEPIHASVKNGVATLTGSISSDSQNALAYRDATSVPGIKDVEDKLVFPGGGPGAAIGGSSIPGAA
jgi:hypothetical protein